MTLMPNSDPSSNEPHSIVLVDWEVCSTVYLLSYFILIFCYLTLIFSYNDH